MYYTSNGAYRKTKTVIDFGILILTVFILGLFATLIFWQEVRVSLFPFIFISGALVNLLSAMKSFINYKVKAGILCMIIATMLTILAVFCFIVATRGF